MKKHLLLAAACAAVASLLQAAPYPVEELQLRVTLRLSQDLGISENTMYNPRFFDGFIYVNQINAPAMGRYPSGSGTPDLAVSHAGNNALEHRMVAPFRGPDRSAYLLGSSSAAAASTTFTRYDFDGSNPVTVNTPGNQIADAFDWVDEHTIIYADYTSGSRNRLYLATVQAEPFSVTVNPQWNAQGYVTTSVTARIRNVRVGDVYSGYAYFGDGGQNNNPAFYALDLETGEETLLGNTDPLTGSGSFGLWTVLERGGYLYVQTTDNGIQVYSMIDATQLDSLHAVYSKADLDAATGNTGAQFFGLDATPDNTKLLLGALQGKVFELGPPLLGITQSATDVVLAWPASVTQVVVQSSRTLSSSEFADLDPQPAVVVDGKLNTAAVPLGADTEFFRLRKSP
jgi:hypothetical protein